MVRLFVDHSLVVEQPVPLSRDQAHYLFSVMRLGVGDTILVFNGKDGEFEATVHHAAKRAGAVLPTRQTRPLQMPPDVWLLFSPIKKARTDFIVEKAAELGVAHILPVQTDHSNAERIRQDRLQAHAVEAVEQCGGTYVPPVAALRKLDNVLSEWPGDRELVFCDESAAGKRLPLQGKSDKWAILIGPEGGFSVRERDRLKGFPFAQTISLGPRILRADTAAVSAITLWQSAFGDW